MAIQTVNTGTDNVGDLCSVTNNNAGEQIISATTSGSVMQLIKNNTGVVNTQLGAIKASGTVNIAGQQADVFTSLAQPGVKIFTSYQNYTSGTPGALVIISIDPGVSFTIESATSVTGVILWMIIA